MKNLKRLLALLLVFPCIFLFGCGKKKTNETETNPPYEETETNPDDDNDDNDDDDSGGGDITTAYYYVSVDYLLPENYTELIDNVSKSVKVGNAYTLPEIEDDKLLEYFEGYYIYNGSEYVSGETTLYSAGETYSGDATTTTTFYAVWKSGFENYLNTYYYTSGLVFSVSGDTATVTSYSGSSEFVVVPKTYLFEENEYTVSSIGDNAFQDSVVTGAIINASNISFGSYAFYGTALENFSFNNVTSVGDYAFYGTLISEFTNSINFSMLEYLGEYAFYNCTKLETVNISNSTITYINEYAFFGCESLSSVSLTNTITEIENYAFSGCSSLTNFSFNSISSFGSYAFSNCTGLTDVTLYSITSMGEGVFSGCSNISSMTLNGLYTYSNFTFINIYGSLSGLKTIILSGSISSIEEYYFANITSLETFDMSGSDITSIGKYAFQGCTNLENIIFSNYLESFNINAFTDTKWYTSGSSVVVVGDTLVYAPQSVTTLDLSSYSFKIISAYLFEYNTTLTSIILPSTLEYIYTYAFRGCTNLQSVTFSSSSALISIGSFAFYDCTSLSSFSLMECSSLTEISEHALEYCSSLTSIYLPDSLTTIGVFAFYKTSFASIEVESDNQYFTFDDSYGILYYKASSSDYRIVYCIKNEEIEIITLSTNVTEVLSGGLSSNSNLQYVYVPTGCSVTFDDKSFSGIIFAESDSVTDNSYSTSIYYMLSSDVYSTSYENDTLTVTIAEDVTPSAGTYFITYNSAIYFVTITVTTSDEETTTYEATASYVVSLS